MRANNKYHIVEWGSRSKVLLTLVLFSLLGHRVPGTATELDMSYSPQETKHWAEHDFAYFPFSKKLDPPLSAGKHSNNNAANIPQTLSSAINEALIRRLDIPIEQANISARQASVAEAKGRFWPTVDLEASARNITEHDKFAGFDVVAEFGGQSLPVRVERDSPDNIADLDLEIVWNLYSGGLDSARLTEARAQERSAYAKLGLKQKDIVLEVVNAYISFAKSHIRYALSKNETQLARENARIAEINLQNSRISVFNKEEAELEAYEKEVAQLKSFQGLERELNKYLVAIGMKISAWQISPDTLDLIGNDATSLDAEELIKSFIPGKDPSLAMALAQVEAARANHRAAKAEYLPRVDVSARFLGVGRSDDSQKDAYEDFARDADIVMIKMNWNLFDGFQTNQRVSRARANLTKSYLELEQKKIELQKEKRDKDLALKIAHDSLSIAFKELTLAKHQQKLAKKKLEANKFSELEYQEQMISYKAAEANLAIAQLDATLAELEYISISYDESQQEGQTQ